MPSKKASQARPSKYEPLMKGVLFVLSGLIGLWMIFDAVKGGNWMFSTSFSSFLLDSIGRNGTIFVMAFATFAFIVGGLWAIINAVIDLRKKETADMR